MNVLNLILGGSLCRILAQEGLLGQGYWLDEGSLYKEVPRNKLPPPHSPGAGCARRFYCPGLVREGGLVDVAALFSRGSAHMDMRDCDLVHWYIREQSCGDCVGHGAAASLGEPTVCGEGQLQLF